MALSLAECLSIPLVDANRMLLAAGHAPHTGSGGTNKNSKPLLQALDHLLKAMDPIPCVLVDRVWEIQSHNGGFERLLRHFVDPERVWRQIGGQKNLARLFYDRAGLCSYIANGSLIGRQTTMRLMREQLSNPQDERLSELINSVLKSPLMPEDWGDFTHSVKGSPEDGLAQSYELHLNHKNGLMRFVVLLATVGAEQDTAQDSIRQLTFVPLDEETRTLL